MGMTEPPQGGNRGKACLAPTYMPYHHFSPGLGLGRLGMAERVTTSAIRLCLVAGVLASFSQ